MALKKYNFEGVGEVPIGCDSTNVSHGSTTVAEKFAEVDETLVTLGTNTAVTLGTGRNLYDKNNTDQNLANKEIQSTGVNNLNGTYRVAKVPVKANTEYIIYNADGVWGGRRFYAFLDSSGNIIDGAVYEWSQVIVDDATQTVGADKVIDENHRRLTTPAGCAYLAIQTQDRANSDWAAFDFSETLMVEEGNWPSGYEDGGGEYITKIGGKPIRCNDNYREKRYDIPLNTYILGDSIATLTSTYGLFARRLCEKFSFKYAFDLAKGGAHWSILKDRSSSDNKDNDIIRQINILKDLVDNSDFPDPELILIHCGQNDISPFYLGHTDFTMVDAEDVFDYTDSDYQDWSSWMLTDVADATSGKYRTNSVAGGMRITIETIRSYWPLCKIVITTPIQIAASGGNVGWAMDGYYWQIVKNMTEAAYRLSVPIIDLARESGMSKTNLSLFKTDGVHLSATGGKRIADIIGRYLISHYGYKNWW